MKELVRVRALARLDPEPEAELERWREALAHSGPDQGEDIEVRIARYEEGREIIVRLTVTLELSDEDVRAGGAPIRGVWFAREQQAGNAEHARRLVIDHLQPLLAKLAQEEVRPSPLGLPIVIDLDAPVRDALELEGSSQPG